MHSHAQACSAQDVEIQDAQVAQVSDVPGASDAYVHVYGIGTAGHVKQVTLPFQGVFDAYATLGDVRTASRAGVSWPILRARVSAGARAGDVPGSRQAAFM